LYWANEFHIDGLRVDAVQSIVDKNFCNRLGAGDACIVDSEDGIAFIRKLNDVLHAQAPRAFFTIAENSAAGPETILPTKMVNGLGFDFTQALGSLHHAIDFFSRSFEQRKHQRNLLKLPSNFADFDRLIFGFNHDHLSTNAPIPFSKIYGNYQQRREGLKLLIAWLWLQPGAKMIFMGVEHGVSSSWDPMKGLDWSLLSETYHSSIQRMVVELNRLIADTEILNPSSRNPARYAQLECECPDLFALRVTNDLEMKAIILINYSAESVGYEHFPIKNLDNWHCVFRTDSFENPMRHEMKQRISAQTLFVFTSKD